MVAITTIIDSLSLKAWWALVSRWFLKGDEGADDNTMCPSHRDLFNPHATCQEPYLFSILAYTSVCSPEELPRELPISNPLLDCECIYYVLTICAHFSLLNTLHLFMWCPGFIISAFCLAKLQNPVVFGVYRTAYLKFNGNRLWSRVDIMECPDPFGGVLTWYTVSASLAHLP